MTACFIRKDLHPRLKRQVGTFLGVLLLTIVTLIVVAPFLWVTFLSFKSNTELIIDPLKLPTIIDFGNYIRAFTTLNLAVLYKNTILVSVVALLFGMTFSYLSSFAISQFIFKSTKVRNSIYYFLIMGLAIPVYILLFPIYRISITFRLINTYASLIIPYIAIHMSFNTLLFVGFMREFPKAIEEAAIIDGCNLMALIAKVVIPITKPVIATVLIFDLLYNWNEFPFAVTLLNKAYMFTISLGISFFKGEYTMDYAAMMAATVIILIPQLIIFGFFQRYIIEGMTAGAVKG